MKLVLSSPSVWRTHGPDWYRIYQVNLLWSLFTGPSGPSSGPVGPEPPQSIIQQRFGSSSFSSPFCTAALSPPGGVAPPTNRNMNISSHFWFLSVKSGSSSYSLLRRFLFNVVKRLWLSLRNIYFNEKAANNATLGETCRRNSSAGLSSSSSQGSNPGPEPARWTGRSLPVAAGTRNNVSRSTKTPRPNQRRSDQTGFSQVLVQNQIPFYYSV